MVGFWIQLHLRVARKADRTPVDGIPTPAVRLCDLGMSPNLTSLCLYLMGLLEEKDAAGMLSTMPG